jgi:hypothetical protein
VNSKERKMLGTIFTFLKSKQFIFIDAENSYTLVRKQENIIEHMYEKA